MWGLLKGLINNIPAVVVIIIAVVMLGVVAFTRLPVDLFPNIEIPIIAVFFEYSGATPEQVEESVARILEGQFQTISGVKNVTTRCFQGRAFFVIEFNYGVDIDSKANDIREKIDFVNRFLPDGVGKPIIFKFDPSLLPIMSISVSGIDDLAALRQIVEDNISKYIYQVDGVANVTVDGGYQKKVFVELDRRKLEAFKVSSADVLRALAIENQDFSAGYVVEGYKKINVKFDAKYKSIDDIKNVVIANRGGYNVKVGDVADVVFKSDIENAPIVKVNGKSGVVMSINKKSDASTVTVSEAVKKKLEEVKKLYPNLSFGIVVDQGAFIVDSINNVRNNAINGAILAFVVVFLFLVSLKESVLIALAIPLSIAITFVIMYFLNVSLNVVSLAGLALGVGMTIDNSIVVIESIYLHKKRGKSIVDAAFDGAKEVGTAVLASTLTTVFVFLPVVFSQGLAQQIFRDLALTVSISIFSSLFVAIWITPPLMTVGWGFIEKLDSSIKRIKFLFFFFDFIENFRDGIYSRLLSNLLNLKKTILAFTIVFVVLGIISFIYVGKELLPTTDSGDVSVKITLPPGTSKNITYEYAEKLSAYLSTNQDVSIYYYVINVGGSRILTVGGGAGENVVNFTIKLKPKEERSISSEEFASKLRRFLAMTIPGMIEVNASSGIRLPGSGGAAADIKILGNDIGTLEKISSQIEAVSKNIKGVEEVKSSIDDVVPEYSLIFDRNKLAFYGISSSVIGNILKSSFQGTTASFYTVGGKQYDIVLQIKGNEKKYLEDILFSYIPTVGGIVPIVDLVKVSNDVAPRMIMRENGSRTVSVSVVSFGVPKDKLVSQISEEVKKSVYIPPDVIISYGGSFRDLQDSLRDLLLIFTLAFALVYTTMVVLFKSFKDPFIILFSIPYGVFSVTILFFLFNIKFNIIAGIGVVMLLGIVVNNGIVMVDYMNQLLEQGYKLREATIEGAKRRLRPVLMTSLTSIIGVLPLSLGIGSGSELFQPLGLTLLLGLFAGKFFTLFVIPVVYEYLNRKRFA
jgi:HAE1 family hydrophobic/amphiphilic exporter-1